MPTSKCPKGKIWRNSYTRKTSKGKKVSVKGNCIKATSQSGKKESVKTKHKLEKKKAMRRITMSREILCPEGQEIRDGFYRKKPNSNEQIWIEPTCVPEKGKKTTERQMPLFFLEKDRLSKYGYSDVTNMPVMSRHKSLKKAIESGEKPLSLQRRLVALSTLTRNTNPKFSRTVREDAQWIKENK